MPFNFWKRKPHSHPAPAPQSDDPERDHLQAEVAKRQEQVAGLQLELLEFTQFNQEIETRLGPWQGRVADLEAELAEAHLRSTRRAMWGARADASDIPEDATQQYKRAWAQPDSPPPPPAAPSDSQSEAAQEAKIKVLYRLLAKRFHPDLASTPEEKAARAERMAEINALYAARDWVKLQAIANEPEQPAPSAPPRPLTRAELVRDLQREIERLDGVIAELENTLEHGLSPALVDFKLEADLARRAGRDLLAEMESDLRAEIAQMEAELASLNA